MMTLYTYAKPSFYPSQVKFKIIGQDIFWQENAYILPSQSKFHMKVCNHHQTLSARAGLACLLPCCAWRFASKSPISFRAFLSSPSGSHVFCIPFPTQSLSYPVSLQFPTPAPRLVPYHLVSEPAQQLAGWWSNRAVGDNCITDSRRNTLQPKRIAVGLDIEMLILDHKHVICRILDGPFIFRCINAHFTPTLTVDSFISIRWRAAATFDATLQRRLPLSGRRTPFLCRFQQRRGFLVAIAVMFILSLVVRLRLLAVPRILLGPTRWWIKGETLAISAFGPAHSLAQRRRQGIAV